ncbi:MAG: hypothetical protein KDA60_01855 [Planctomycetales bacterium]|nr:hypothetical protein [Planctomycetales bacterium]
MITSPSDLPNEDSAVPTTPVRRRVWQPRYRLPTLLLIMLVASMTAASAGHLHRALSKGTGVPVKAVFIIFTLVVPMLLLAAVSLATSLWGKRHRRRRRRF